MDAADAAIADAGAAAAVADSDLDPEQLSASAPPSFYDRGTQWSTHDDDSSISSTESNNHHSKLGNFFKKAKAKGKRLVHRKKKQTKVVMVDETFQTDSSLMEAIADDVLPAPSIDFSGTSDPAVAEFAPSSTISDTQPTATPPPKTAEESLEDNLDCPDPPKQPFGASFVRRIPFFKLRVVALLSLVVMTCLLPFWLVSYFWGIYTTIIVFFHVFVTKFVPSRIRNVSADALRSVAKEIDRRKALKESLRYRGWMNELRRRYDPLTYSVNMTQSVMVDVEGKMLHLARPKRNVFKHTFYQDPTLTGPEPEMNMWRSYDLTDAHVSIQPRGLARRRWWNRKYPIVIQLARQKHTSSVDNGDSDSDFSGSESEGVLDNHVLPEENGLRYRWVKSKSNSDFNFPEASEKRQSLDALLGPTKSIARGKKIILFSRSSREKERWFHCFREASSMNRSATGPTLDDDKRASNLSLPLRVDMDRSSVRNAAAINVDIEYYLYVSNSLQFAKTMAEIMKSSSVEYAPDSGVIYMNLDQCHWSPKEADFKSEVVLAANAAVARVFFDFCRDERWIRAVRNQIEVKLTTIELPYFIETLTLSEFKLGTTIPQVIGVHAPVLNEWGLWVDVEIKYDGGLQLGLETKVDLVMMMEKQEAASRKVALSRLKSDTKRHYSDDELSDSPENSATEDFGEYTITPSSSADEGTAPSGGVGKKILSVMGKVAKTQLFQNAAEFGPIKKIMEEVSSTRLMLNVDVTLLEGTLALNIPPPPSDRLWFGFRRPPKFSMKAVPQVGDRAVDMSSVSDWIETRLHTLLEKQLVVPNMTDISVPLTSGNEMLKFGYNS